MQQHYDQTSVCWQETANRQLESLNQQREELSAQAAAAEKVFASQHETLQAYVHAHTLTEQTATGDAQYQTLIRDYAAAQTAYQGLRQRESICEAQIQEIAASVDPQMKTEYRGMNGTNFSDSYDAYITQPQGKAVPGFGGVCGINETCSIVNQQTGSSLDEADGIREYVSKGLCVINDTYEHNGGTNAVNRSVFLEEKGLTFIRIEGAYDTGVSISLDAIARRFQAGESAGIMLKAEDLSQPALASRRFNLRKTLEENRFRFHANHATTIAGFSYDGAGNVTGVWLNDTGDWTGSNRVFIDAEKFERMQNNTKGFAVEFSRRR